jgi:hypothetical protein
MLMRKFEATQAANVSRQRVVFGFAVRLAHFFVAVARDGFGLLLVELGVAKFARVAYRNILDEVC